MKAFEFNEADFEKAIAYNERHKHIKRMIKTTSISLVIGLLTLNPIYVFAQTLNNPFNPVLNPLNYLKFKIFLETAKVYVQSSFGMNVQLKLSELISIIESDVNANQMLKDLFNGKAIHLTGDAMNFIINVLR